MHRICCEKLQGGDIEAHTSRKHPRDIFGKSVKVTGKENSEAVCISTELNKCTSDTKLAGTAKEDMKDIINIKKNTISRKQPASLKGKADGTMSTGLMDKDSVLPTMQRKKEALVLKELQHTVSVGKLHFKKCSTFLPQNKIILIFCDGAGAINNLRKETGAKIRILNRKGDGEQEVIISGTEEAVEKAQLAIKNNGEILLSDFEHEELIKNRASIRRNIALQTKTSIYINKRIANIFGSEEARKKALSMIKKL